ncbi:MAG: DMT family transporter, partial [Pseudomonadota bacterium]
MTDFSWSVMLSLAAACLFGLGAQFARLGLRTLSAQDGAGISILSAFLLYWLVSPWYLDSAWWGSSVVWLFALVGLFRPAISTTFAMTGTAILGATISTTVASTSPFFGLLFGVVFLNEPLTPGVALGTLGIIGGVMLLAWRGGAVAGNWPLWALLLPLGAAVIRVTAHLLTKIGMEEVASPFFAGLVAYTASLALASANAVRRRT